MKSQKEFANLIIADPPFNIGYKYDIYNDKRDYSEYMKWTYDWINECKRILHDDGNMLICMGDEYVSDIDVMCRKDIGLKRIEWMIWHYKFGQSGKLDQRRKFTRSKTHILRLCKNDKPYFNAPAVAIPSDRLKKYSDNRADKRGKCPDDVFIYKRIAGTHNERVEGVKTQMPVALLEIWIKSMCKPNGIVFDPFPGSGASLVAAKKLGYDFMGVELSNHYTDIINKRLTLVSRNNI